MSDRKRADEALAVGLASGQTIKDASAQAGVSARTARRRLEEPDFRQRVSELRGQAVERAASLLADGAAEAVKVLVELLDAAAHRPTTRLQAAKAILDNVMRTRELLDLEERVRKLEEVVS